MTQIAGVLKTDGGPHSAEKWAVVTAGQIIQIGADASGLQAIEGRRLENKIIDIIEKHHGDVQSSEREAIKKVGDERLMNANEPTSHLDAAVAEVIAATKGTIFEKHFSDEKVVTYVRNVIGQHMATVAHIERSWHADRNPNSPHAKAFRAAWHGAK